MNHHPGTLTCISTIAMAMAFGLETSRSQWIPGVDLDDRLLEAGLAYRYYEFTNSSQLTPPHSVDGLDLLTPLEEGVFPTITLGVEQRSNHFGIILDGVLKIETAGMYMFFLNSDDGSKFFLNGTEVIDNDGLHGTRIEAAIIHLEAGFHELQVRYFERIGRQALNLLYQGADSGGIPVEVPATVLCHLVEDDVDPVAVCRDADVALEAGGTITISGDAVDGGSTDDRGIESLTVVPDTFTCADLGQVIPVTLTVTDIGGNTRTCIAQVTVLDPDTHCCSSLTLNIPGDLTLDCGASTDPSMTGIATIAETCCTLPGFSIVHQDTILPGDCPQAFTVSRVWVGRDGCGNETVGTQTITVIDDQAPVFNTVPPHVIVNCSGVDAGTMGRSGSGGSNSDSGSGGLADDGTMGRPGLDDLPTEVPPVPTVFAVDACDSDVETRFVEVTVGAGPGAVIRTWTAEDDCGNASEVIQLVLLKKICVHTVAFWADNPEAWLTSFGPVTELELTCDGEFVTAEDALAILGLRAGGDTSIALAQELIAAQLNVSQGAESPTGAALIQEARDLLCTLPIGSEPSGELKRLVKDLAHDLADYNAGDLDRPSCRNSD